MIELEQDLIGACLNTPSAAKAATGVLPEHFTDGYLGAIWSSILRADGRFTVRTIAADVSAHPGYAETGGLTYLSDIYSRVPFDFTGVPATAAKVIEAFKRRQVQASLDHAHNALGRGDDFDATMADLSARTTWLKALGSKASRFTPVAAIDLDVPITPWLVKGIMPTKGVGFIAGAPGAGKSFLCLNMSLGLSAGQPNVLGRRAKKCGVVYIAAEDFDGCKARVLAWRTEARHEGDLPFEMIGGNVNLLDAACVEDLGRALAEVGSRFADNGIRLGLVVVDTMARCLPGADENSAEHMSLALRGLEALAEHSGAFVVAVAHHGKSGTTGGIRGWSGMNGGSDMTLTVERSEENPDVRIMTASKVKNGVDGHQLAFRLQKVQLGIFDEDGDEMDSCVCAFEDMPERQLSAHKRLPPNVEIALKAVKYVTDNYETFPVPHGMPKANWSRAIEFLAVKTYALKNGFAQDKSAIATHARFSAALEKLVAENRIRMDTDTDLIWLI